MPAPKIELKAIKVDRRASQETIAYSANLFVDGRHIAVVGNDGHGGSDRFIGPGKGLEYSEAFRAYNETTRRVRAESPQVNLADPGQPANMVEDDLDFMCQRLVDDYQIAKEMDAMLRRQVIFFENGAPDEGKTAPLFSYRIPDPKIGATLQFLNQIKQRYPNVYILNEQTRADALAAFRRQAAH